MLHASHRKMIFLKNRIVWEDCQHVGEGIANSKDRFHLFCIDRCKFNYIYDYFCPI